MDFPTHPPSLKHESTLGSGGHAAGQLLLKGSCYSLYLTYSSSTELPLHQELSWTTFVLTFRLYRQPQRSLVTSAFPARKRSSKTSASWLHHFCLFLRIVLRATSPQDTSSSLSSATPSASGLFLKRQPLLLLSPSSILLGRGLATQPSSWLLACCFYLHFLWWAFIAQRFTL